MPAKKYVLLLKWQGNREFIPVAIADSKERLIQEYHEQRVPTLELISFTMQEEKPKGTFTSFFTRRWYIETTLKFDQTEVIEHGRIFEVDYVE